jgi:hypothetical protein
MALESYFELKYQLSTRDNTNIVCSKNTLFQNFTEYRYYFSILE